MNFHLCKSRRGSNPDAVVNCNNSSAGGVTPGSQNDLDPSAPCGSIPVSIQICPTTGGLFQMDIDPNETVEGLKRIVAKKLGVSSERISLLYRERLLKEGSLKDNRLNDGSRITLLPRVETGLSSPRPEVTVMQALENLSESQVNDFLAGKSPLTLAMRLGKHMMFLQLQLSTVQPATKRSHVTRTNSNKGCHDPQQHSPHTLTVPVPNTAPMETSNGPHGRLPNSASLLPPASIVTPPPSPNSPSTSSSTLSPYTYPITSFPTSPTSPVTQTKDVPLDAANTPPPSPCYIHKPIPTMPAMPKSDSPQAAAAPHKMKQPGLPFMDTPTLAAAKRSLSKKLQEFSKQASCERTSEASQPAAVIETMQRLRHGVYSGTFSGTLNPALQDQDGKPRRSISTIVHILNDLLGASHPRVSGGEAQPRMYPRQRPETVPRPNLPQQQESSPRLQQENQAIKGKLERLQRRLEERKRRRQARRDARVSPYSTGQTYTDDQGCHNGELLESMDMYYDPDIPASGSGDEQNSDDGTQCFDVPDTLPA